MENIQRIINTKKSLETIYTNDKNKIYDLYNKIFAALGGNGENSICQSLYSMQICDCCEFPNTETHEDGRPTNTFIGMLPFEQEYLQGKASEVTYADKFVEHQTRLGIVCRISETTCNLKPVDCAIYPCSFANFVQQENNVSLDIRVATHKCSIFSDPKLRDQFINIMSHRLIKVAEITYNFDPRILELWTLFDPFYRGYEKLQTILIPMEPIQQIE